MIGDAGPEWPSFNSWMHFYVNDVDASYQRALKAGGVSVQEPEVKADEFDKRGGIKDPSGNTWWIATQIANVAIDFLCLPSTPDCAEISLGGICDAQFSVGTDVGSPPSAVDPVELKGLERAYNATNPRRSQRN